MDVQISLPPPPPPPPPPGFFSETTTRIPPPPPPPPSFLTETTTSVVPPAAPSQPTTTVVTNSSTQDRIWLHPWTVAEMRENASNWSLAGDAGLLLCLEQFSDKLVQRADAIQQHLNQTVNAVKSTHIRVQNCLNEFTSLANTQFIENRVYDEDETIDNETLKKDEPSAEKTNINNTEAQEKVLQRYVEAIQYGLSILETHFERVEPKLEIMENGNSSYVDDDEDGGLPTEPILEPKDPYLLRPLPYLIGSPEFMQDDYVGLSSLLNLPEEEAYGDGQIQKVETDSVLSNSDEDEDEDDFKVEISPAPIVPAGASRPDLANRLAPTKTTIVLTDEEDDDDDPFKLNAAPKFDDLFSKKPLDSSADENLFPTPNISTTTTNVQKTVVQGSFKETDNEEKNFFDEPIKKPQLNSETLNDKIDNQSLSSNESNEIEEQRKLTGISIFGSTQQGMSELEKAVLRRRKALGDPDLPTDDTEVEIKKTIRISNQPNSSIGTKTTRKPTSDEPPSNTISQLVSQPLPKPGLTIDKTPKSSIFGEQTGLDDDDGDDIFGGTSKLPSLPTVKSTTTTTTTVVSTKPSTTISTKKEKSLFDSDSDGDDPFKPKETVSSSSNAPAKTPSTITNKTTTITAHNDSDDEDEIFMSKNRPAKQTPVISKTTIIEKTKTVSFNDKESRSNVQSTVQQSNGSVVLLPVPSSNEKLKPTTFDDSDEDPIFGKKTSKPSVQKPEPKKVNPPTSSDDENPLFDIKPKASPVKKTEPQKVLPSTSPDDEDSPFGIKTSKPPIQKTEPQKVLPSTSPDDEESLFGITISKPPVKKPEPQKVLPSTSPDDDESLFGIKTSKPPVQKTEPQKVLPATSRDDDDDSMFGITTSKRVNKSEPEKVVSPAKPQDKGQSVEQSKPSTIQKAKEISVPSDDEDKLFSPRPLQVKLPPPVVLPSPPVVKTETNVDPLSATQKLVEPSPAPIKESIRNELSNSEDEDIRPKKINQAALKDDEKPNVRALKSLLNIPVSAHRPGTRPTPSKQTENQTKPSDDNESSISNNKTKKLSTLDSDNDDDLFSPQKDKTVSPPVRQNQTEKSNSTISKLHTNININPAALLPGASPSSISNENNNSSTTSKEDSNSEKTVINLLKDRAKRPTGSRAPPSRKSHSTATASIASTNDNDDLFSSSPIATTASPSVVNLPKVPETETKSPAIAKPTTTTAKPSVVSLDDDDNDFLSKRPVKKSKIPSNTDDIFADITIKSQQTNKAKKDWSIVNKTSTNETDDIFNDILPKSSTTSKSKTTNVKTKSTKDIFDDPLNISSKQ